MPGGRQVCDRFQLDISSSTGRKWAGKTNRLKYRKIVRKPALKSIL